MNFFTFSQSIISFRDIINMSKILLIGDTHLGLGYPNSVDKWFNVHKDYFENFLIPLVEREMTPEDIVVHLGDLFDNRSVIPINILNYTQNILERISKICPIHMIVGNHDLYTKSTNDVNSIKLYRYIPNVYVYEDPTILNFVGKKILLLPWVEKRKNQVEYLQKFSGCDYLFCHSDLNGAKMHLTSVAHKNNDKIDVNEFSGYKKVYSGHIHILQRNKNFTFVGNIFQMDRNDLGNEKGIFILDTITGEERFVINELSPKYIKVFVKEEGDIEKLDNYSTKDYIDLFVSNSLLLNNRKLRRKLESMLERGNFSTVEYLDDMSKIETVNESSVKDETPTLDQVTHSLKLEYTDVIKEYIDRQKWESEKIKEGVMTEFSEVVRLYNENYKNHLE